nr:cyanoexosortase C [Nodosilinea sp. TSF1-S3]MDF0367321.1 cyanoexosortase C [Nodosilinea sp. TSF1-S3]
MTQFSVLPRIQDCLRSFHGSLVLLGLFVGLCYLPIWLAGLLDRVPQSSDGFTLATAFVGLSLYMLWKQHRQLAQLEASEADRLLGHMLIIAAIGLFPFCRFAIWPQAILWALILSGIACSTWGLRFFAQHQLLVAAALATVYPRPTVPVRLLWEAITPYKFLERWMAQAGAGALQLLGWPATAVQSLVTFPEGAVDVNWGCNGFDMALIMAVTGLVMGVFLKQSWKKTLGFVGIGIVAALAFNVPRIMLLAVASVYWGQSWFDFWHGPWGGQLFTGLLFTVYYYTVMAMVKRRSGKAA